MYQWILSTIAAFLATPFVNSESIVNITAAETIMGRWTSRVRETEWGPLQEDITFGPECHVEIRYTFMKGGGEVEQCTYLASYTISGNTVCVRSDELGEVVNTWRLERGCLILRYKEEAEVCFHRP